MTGNKKIKTALIEEVKLCEKIHEIKCVGGGCINDGYRYETNRGTFFVKVNHQEPIEMFEAEFEGLKEMSPYVRVPKPYYVGKLYDQDNSGAFFIMEYVHMKSSLTSHAEKILAKNLANLHLNHNESMKFGFHIDNTIGSSPQINTKLRSSDNWIDFFIENRLRFQLNLPKVKKDQTIQEVGDILLGKVKKLFPSHVTKDIKPSLIHGDLWSGNASMIYNQSKLEDGNPIVYDPACYYAHHEMELSIMDIFGGFSNNFYEEYHKYIPKSEGFEERQSLYQLYHYLNHYNLFGSGYRHTCISIMKQLIDTAS